MSSHETATACVRKLQANFGERFQRPKELYVDFVDLLIDKLMRCSDEVAASATDWVLSHCDKRWLVMERVDQGIRATKAAHQQTDYYNPDVGEAYKCVRCHDRGLTLVYVQFLQWLYECVEPCADNCEAGEIQREAYDRYRRQCPGPNDVKALARFDADEWRESEEWRVDWWDKYRLGEGEAGEQELGD